MTCEPHVWNQSGPWGVIIGVSSCIHCGKVATTADFDTRKRREELNAEFAGRPRREATEELVAPILNEK